MGLKRAVGAPTKRRKATKYDAGDENYQPETSSESDSPEFVATKESLQNLVDERQQESHEQPAELQEALEGEPPLELYQGSEEELQQASGEEPQSELEQEAEEDRQEDLQEEAQEEPEEVTEMEPKIEDEDDDDIYAPTETVNNPSTERERVQDRDQDQDQPMDEDEEDDDEDEGSEDSVSPVIVPPRSGLILPGRRNCHRVQGGRKAGTSTVWLSSSRLPKADAESRKHSRVETLKSGSTRAESPIAGTKGGLSSVVKSEPSAKLTTPPSKPGSSYPAIKSSSIDVNAVPIHEATGKPITELDLDEGQRSHR